MSGRLCCLKLGWHLCDLHHRHARPACYRKEGGKFGVTRWKAAMTRLSVLLASVVALNLGGQNAMAKDASEAADVQEKFGLTVVGAGPVTLVGTITRLIAGNAEDVGPVSLIETINRSELVKMVPTFSSEETEWPSNPFEALAQQVGSSPERRWDRELTSPR
jgi:hypothetical protein